jgi:hypothetical protein
LLIQKYKKPFPNKRISKLFSRNQYIGLRMCFIRDTFESLTRCSNSIANMAVSRIYIHLSASAGWPRFPIHYLLHSASFGSTQQGGIHGIAHPLIIRLQPPCLSHCAGLKLAQHVLPHLHALKKFTCHILWMGGGANKKENKGKAGSHYLPLVAGKVKPSGF